MINFDNIYLLVFYAIFGFPVAIIKFLVLNVLALVRFNGLPTIKELWTSQELTKVFVNPNNLLIGLVLFIGFVLFYYF